MPIIPGIPPPPGLTPPPSRFPPSPPAPLFRAVLVSLPNPKVLLNPTRVVKELGPRPKLRGISASPTAGVKLKLPNGVHLMLTAEQSAPGGAKEGRSVYKVSPLISLPSVMLNGAPELTIKKGFKLTLGRDINGDTLYTE